MLAEQIVKLDCGECRLRTEHYLLREGDMIVACRCLRCGQLQSVEVLAMESHEYPEDRCRPVYLL